MRQPDDRGGVDDADHRGGGKGAEGVIPAQHRALVMVPRQDQHRDGRVREGLDGEREDLRRRGIDVDQVAADDEGARAVLRGGVDRAAEHVGDHVRAVVDPRDEGAGEDGVRSEVHVGDRG